MGIDFPNQSRSYDGTRRMVRFWGHDRSMEASFFVAAAALEKIQPDLRAGEEELLRAFDQNRHLIYAAAKRVYARGHKGSYDIGAGDF